MESQQIEQAEAGAQARWNALRSSVNERFAELRAEAEQRRAERDAHEEDAIDAIDVALLAIDQAEYTIADAVIARAEAEELAGSRG